MKSIRKLAENVCICRWHTPCTDNCNCETKLATDVEMRWQFVFRKPWEPGSVKD